MRKSNKINLNGASKVYYQYGIECEENSLDMNRALDYLYGVDRNSDNSIYTIEEKQRALDKWLESTDSTR